MRVIIGYGNELRGEDAFGVDVIKELNNLNLTNTKLISTFQLTPELCLELLEAEELIFVDASYSGLHQYILACPVEISYNQGLTHYLNPHTLVGILKVVYNHYPEYKIYSMLTDSFDQVWDNKRYKSCVNKLVNFLYD
jgi:hydrogenase maturation protease